MSDDQRGPPEVVPQERGERRSEATEIELSEVAEELSELIGREVETTEAAQIISVTRGYARSYSFAGPLPPPAYMREYVDILGDGGNRIVTMAEKEQNHRHQLDLKEVAIDEAIVTGDGIRANRGQWMFYSIVLIFVLGGLLGLLLEKPLAGFASLGGAVVAALTGIFGPRLTGLTRRSKEDNTSKVQDGKDKP